MKTNKRKRASYAFQCFAVSDLIRIFEDGYNLAQANRKSTIEVFGLRNEIVSAQFIIQANKDLKNLSVSVEPLNHSRTPAVIDLKNVQWNFVNSIFIQENTPKLIKDDLIRSAPAWFPDYLSDERLCSLKKGTLKAVFLTLCIPENAEPGEYKTQVSVTEDNKKISLPLVLTVYPVALPNERHIKVSEWYSTRQFKKHNAYNFDDDKDFLKILRLYAQNMVEHRQNVFRMDMNLIECTQSLAGELKFDFSAFDRQAEVFWETNRMDLMETGFVARFGEKAWYSSDIVLKNFPVKNEQTGESKMLPGKDFLPKFLPVFVEHLRVKKWLNKTAFHICDEPSNHNIVAWRNVSDFIHSLAPELKRLDAIESPHCFDRLEIWVPKLDHLSTWQSLFEEAQSQGYELWLYTVGIFQKGSLPNKTVDVSLIESRIMHWLNYRFGLKGYLHWGFNAWTDDPFNAPGTHRGDGWHVYPKADGLLNSLRWEQMRNGLQDYECLWLLDYKIDQIRNTLSKHILEFIRPSRRGIEIAMQVVETYNQYTKDPNLLYAARQQAIEEIIDLDDPPCILLETNPLEHSTVADDVSIDIHGWAEPGTKITVNDKQLPVSSDGLFIEQISLNKKESIVLEAESSKGQKTIVRKFKKLY